MPDQPIKCPNYKINTKKSETDGKRPKVAFFWLKMGIVGLLRDKSTTFF